MPFPTKGQVKTSQDIAHIYVILHDNHFSILSKGTDHHWEIFYHMIGKIPAVIVSAFAEIAKMVAVEDYMDVISWQVLTWPLMT